MKYLDEPQKTETEQKLLQEKKDRNILVNVQSILIYVLSFSVALGFNELITSIFDSFPGSKHIVAKTTYVVVMFGITLLAAYWIGGLLND